MNFEDNRRRVIATDGVFSMEGDVAPLKEISDLADRCDAPVFVDECHATGRSFFGPTGHDTEKHLGIQGRNDIINSMLGKVLGGTMGGYTIGPKPFIDLLTQRSDLICSRIHWRLPLLAVPSSAPMRSRRSERNLASSK
ncbi:unnamed protein product [Onchocerca ochengi]|uniref:Aminotran_1_2 domain-containing protein n=1 Tax=Onchocerca ochengi TaxID=42157 RepID=A0A182E014_ONCOC|nr:unnamed protein product [Onchocerca ochengi]